MTATLLLLLTVFCGYLTFDAFRMVGLVKDSPFSVIAKLWGNRGDHLSLAEQDQNKTRFSSFVFGAGKLAFMFLAITVALAFATLRAFLE